MLAFIPKPGESPNMLSGPQRKFCEGIVAGLNQTEAYAAAYPKASRDAARSSAPGLLAKDSIRAEIARMRALADERAGSAVLTLAEKRKWLARLLRVNPATLDTESDGDLLAGVDIEEGRAGSKVKKIRVADKIAAIKLDNDLAGEGSEAEANDALAGLLSRVME